MLVINYYNNFTNLLYLIQPMRLFRQWWIVLAFIFLFSVVFPSCSSRSREAVCKGNSTYRGYTQKKNKSRYIQKYTYKNRSVRKDYVIKNGIAH
ncbi:MAG: hypothetical protein D4R97_04525 [Bacteroidetes bacterium]|nr:MAG: hypothetical protein D4R97_04525 [Bacteroidota bacterium]